MLGDGGLRRLRAGRAAVPGVQVHPGARGRDRAATCWPVGTRRARTRDHEPAGATGRAGPEPLVRLHHPRPGRLGRAGAADPRGRAPGDDLQPHHLREGGRGQRRLRRGHPAAEPARAARRARSSRRSRWPTSARPATRSPSCTAAPAGSTARCRWRCPPSWRTTPTPPIHEAHRLWAAVDRPNAMIKIPGTEAGLPAITRCIADGISVNVTLLFSVERYARGHRGLARRHGASGWSAGTAGECRWPRWRASS